MVIIRLVASIIVLICVYASLECHYILIGWGHFPVWQAFCALILGAGVFVSTGLIQEWEEKRYKLKGKWKRGKYHG